MKGINSQVKNERTISGIYVDTFGICPESEQDQEYSLELIVSRTGQTGCFSEGNYQLKIKILMDKLINDINQLGQQVVNCAKGCDGINKIDKKKGIIPRCLYLDDEGRTGKQGCVIVGINPGISKSKERNHYRKNGAEYQTVKAFWKKHGYNFAYYKYLRDFADRAGYTGPILWTELVKCENLSGKKLPPMQTFRRCTFEFLSKELAAVPDEWMIIAVGKEVHKALCYRYPDKAILGIPHTNSRGQFAGLFVGSKRQKFTESVNIQLKKFKKSVEKGEGAEIWLEN